MPARCFSESGYNELIKRANQDGVLTLAVGQREDLSDARLKQLLAARSTWFAAACMTSSSRSGGTRQAGGLRRSPVCPSASRNKRDFVPAQRTILSLREGGHLNEGPCSASPRLNRYEESVAALSAMSGVHIQTLEQSDLERSSRSHPDSSARPSALNGRRCVR